MKLIHLSDLHLGKRVNGFSLLEDQEYILSEIVRIVEEEASDGVIIAGDVYDKAVPSAEAVSLFDDFLYRLAARGQQIFVISGNHDSPERIAFGSRIMDRSGVHLSPVYNGQVQPVTVTDSYGRVNVFLLPFIRPANVRRFYPEEEITDYAAAVRTAIAHMELPKADRNILVTHQFVTGAVRSDSEEISVGGSDQVDASVMKEFDYVALGHLHRPQQVGRETLRYCGTPLKYSFSEAGDHKSVTCVELGAKGDVTVRTVPLVPKRDMREIRGTYLEVTARSFYEGMNREDYLHITLTDEEDVPDAIRKLRVIYPNIMKLDYDNRRTRCGAVPEAVEQPESRSPLELFEEFYERQNGQAMTKEQRLWMSGLIEEIWEGAH